MRFFIPAIMLMISFPLAAQTGEPPRYNRDIRPLLAEKCFTCHGPDAKQRKAGLRLDSADQAAAVLADAVRAIVPGKRDESALWQRIVSTDPDKKMPPPESKKELSPAQIERLGQWIESGAEYEPHWAFVPPVEHPVPATGNTAWQRNEIDAFVLNKLESKGLTPNPEANRRDLIRRAYFDLLGLPPTPEAVDAFEDDTAPDAYDRLIDGLLDNPHFGERWARYWLDIARFAESHGYEQDYDRPYAYHYRDFVVKAFNQDLPYDQFVRWQIAGDELEPRNPLALAATGFLGAGTHATQITKSQVEKERYDELDDMARTTALSFLGLTLGCARCHDHKYDPIPTEDYYRLLSTFTTTVRADLDINMDPADYEARLVAFTTAHEPLEAAVAAREQSLRPAFEPWLNGELAHAPDPDWVVVDFQSMKSENDGEFTRLDDGSYRVEGRHGNQDSYTLVAEFPPATITGIRLEALRDPAFVHGGPGRAVDGNFALSALSLMRTPAEAGKEGTPAALVNPRTDFTQTGTDIAGLLDDKADTGWAIDGGQGKDHVVVAELAAPLTLAEGETLTITLPFKMKNVHTLGRFRISLAVTPHPLGFHGASMDTTAFAAWTSARSGNAGTLPAEQRETLFKYFCQLDAQWQSLRAAADAHAADAPLPQRERMMVCSEGVPAIRTHTQGGDYLELTHFLKRGDPNQKGDVATQSFVHALMRGPEAQWQIPASDGAKLSYRRTALANWITDFDHGAGFLLARVMVNRMWQFHFGRGLVSTSSDFGLQGAAPSHPELLDWLALELVSNGWRLKPLHKLMMQSAAYRQSSAPDAAKIAADQENALWGRFPPRRLEAESIRDSLLSVSGLLDETMYGPGTLDDAHTRRSLYFMVKRSKLIPMMMLFDAPDTTQSLANRTTTTIAPQALHLMNNEQVRRWAEAFAKRVEAADSLTEAEMVRHAYRLALSRDPDQTEAAAALEFMRVQQESYQKAGQPLPRHLAFTDFCQTLMSLNEFVYIQ